MTDPTERSIWDDDELEAWRQASPTERAGAIHREIVRARLVRRLRWELEVGEIDREEYCERCVEVAKMVWENEYLEDLR